MEDRFATRTGKRLSPLVEAGPGGGVAQHSFHVFAVYPWLGLLARAARTPRWRSWTGAGSAGDVSTDVAG